MFTIKDCLIPLGNSKEKHPSKIVLEALYPKTYMEVYRKYIDDYFNMTVSYSVISSFDEALLPEFYNAGDPTAPPLYFDFMVGSDRARFEDAAGLSLVVLQEGGRGGLSFRKIHDQRLLHTLERKKDIPTLIHLTLRWEHGGWTILNGIRNGYVPIKAERLFMRDAEAITSSLGCFVCDVKQALGKEILHLETHIKTFKEAIFQQHILEAISQVGEEFMLVSHLRSKPKAQDRRTTTPSNTFFATLDIFSKQHELNDVIPVVAVTIDMNFYRLSDKFEKAVKKLHCQSRNPPNGRLPGKGIGNLGRRGEGAPLTEEEVFDFESAAAFQADDYMQQDDGCPCYGCREAPRYKNNMSLSGPQKLYTCDLGLFDLMRIIGRDEEPYIEAIKNACKLSIGVFDVESMSRKKNVVSGNEDFSRLKPQNVSSFRLPAEPYAVHEPVLIGYWDRLLEEEEKTPIVLKTQKNGNRGNLEENFLELIRDRRDLAVSAKKSLLAPLTKWVSRYKAAHTNFFMIESMQNEDFLIDLEGGPCYGGSNFDADSDEDSSEDEASSAETFDCESSTSSQESTGSLETKKSLPLSSTSLPNMPLLKGETPKNTSISTGGKITGKRKLSTISLKEEALSKRQCLEEKNLENLRKQAIEKAWDHSLLGMFDRRLKKLEKIFSVFAFNGESFDLVILATRIVTAAKQMKLRGVSLHLDGAKVRRIKVEGIQIGEIKRLMPPGSSLDSMGKACGLEEQKGIFPFDLFNSLDFLDEKMLPSLASEWVSVLAPEKAPTQSQVNEAIDFCTQKGFTSIGQYLEHYLHLDVIVLQKSIIKMQEEYFKILGLDFMEANKFTASSFSALAAQTFLLRNKRIGCFSPNHCRSYSVSKKDVYFFTF